MSQESDTNISKMDEYMQLFALALCLLVCFLQSPTLLQRNQDGFAIECIYLLGFIPKLYFIIQLRPRSLKCYSGRQSAVILHWTALAVWIVIATILIWTWFNRTSIGMIITADAILTVFLTLAAVIILDHKHFVADRDEMSLPEQYDKYLRDSGIDMDHFIKIYTEIAPILGYDVLYLRPTDKFCDYWDDLDLLDLFVGLSRRLKISSIQDIDVRDRLGSVESISDFVLLFNSVLNKRK
jgi:hypothetical protein